MMEKVGLMKKFLLFQALFFLFPFHPKSQEVTGVEKYNTVTNGDTIPYIFLPEVTVPSPVNFGTNKERLEFNLLVYNVKKTYPYAKVAAIKINEYNNMVSKAKSNHERKKLMRFAEDDLRSKFEEEIKGLTYTQGKILMKLIYRETGESSYKIIKEYRGPFRVFFWQSIAKIFGYDLKAGYDPDGEDKAIEQVVQLIENGSV
jgi:hypothetical protein